MEPTEESEAWEYAARVTGDSSLSVSQIHTFGNEQMMCTNAMKKYNLDIFLHSNVFPYFNLASHIQLK